MGHQPEVLLTLHKSDPHCCEITLENGKIYITDRIKMPLSSYLSRQFWFWLMIWNFCGLGVHTAASCLWLCNPQSPHTWEKCEKMQENALSNPQRSPFPSVKYFQNGISISPIANSFTPWGFNKLHIFLKTRRYLTPAKDKAIFHWSKRKEAEYRLNSSGEATRRTVFGSQQKFTSFKERKCHHNERTKYLIPCT